VLEACLHALGYPDAADISDLGLAREARERIHDSPSAPVMTRAARATILAPAKGGAAHNAAPPADGFQSGTCLSLA